MNLAVALFRSSIGRKILMAVTGLLLILWITGHLFGNLHLFEGPDAINGYAAFLQSLGPVLWIERIGLLVIAALHLWAGVVLTIENRQARSTAYDFKHTIRATLASRAMRVTAVAVLLFVLYHLLHFTIGVNGNFFQGDTFKTALPEYEMQHDFHLFGMLLVTKGTAVHDVFSMLVLGFQNPIVAVAYMVAVGFLTFHLWHGVESMFQTLGLRTSRWLGCLTFVTRAYCLVYFVGNLAIPASILLGCVTPNVAGAPTVHAALLPLH